MRIAARQRVKVWTTLVLSFAMAAGLLGPAEAAAGDTVIFSDNFEGGNLANWRVNTAVNGTAVVQSGIGHDGPNAAHITVPSANGSLANIQYPLPTPRYGLSASGWFKALAGGCDSSAYYSSGNLPFFRFFDANSRRVVGLYRINGPNCGDNTKMYVQHSGGFFRVGKNIRFGLWYKLELRAVVAAPGSSFVEVYVNGSLAFRTATADNGLLPFSSVVVHNEHANQVGELVADDIVLSTFETSPPPTNPCATGSALPTTSDPGTTIIADGFEGYNFGSWTQVDLGGDGLASIQTSTVKTGNCAAKLHVTSGTSSKASAWKSLPAGTDDLWADGWFNVQTEGASNSNVPFFRAFKGASRIIDIYRQNVSGALYVRLPNGSGFSYHSLGVSVALGGWHRVKLHADANGAGTDVVQAWIDGTQRLNKSDASLGVADLSALRIGSEHAAQVMDLIIDDVVVKGS